MPLLFSNNMILSNVDIKNRIDARHILIEPFAESNTHPASYAFTLGTNLLQPMGNDLIDFRTRLLPDYQEITMTKEGYVLEPGELILGQTLEKLTLSPGIAMVIEGRSSLARCGIEVVHSTFSWIVR